MSEMMEIREWTNSHPSINAIKESGEKILVHEIETIDGSEKKSVEDFIERKDVKQEKAIIFHTYPKDRPRLVSMSFVISHKPQKRSTRFIYWRQSKRLAKFFPEKEVQQVREHWEDLFENLFDKK